MEPARPSCRSPTHPHRVPLLILSLLLHCLFIFLHRAAAVISPNMSTCNRPSLLPASRVAGLNCCAPSANYTPRLFTPSSSSSGMAPSLRMRRPAHLVDQAYAAQLARGYALMKALPVDDPRSFTQQANIHCAYCNNVYNQMNSSNFFLVHGTWLFFPFHRWYLYFHERILAKLLEDDNFTLPFWNYDHPDGAAIPWLYSGFNRALSHALRDPLHVLPAPAAVDFAYDTDRRSEATQLRENANAMYRAIIRDANSKEAFFGEAYREGKVYPTGVGFGSVELRPHNSVHLWVGQKSQIGWEDMGSFYAAARDPLFYAHHSALDRLWEVWKTFPNNSDIEDEEYLDAEFAFYNEDAELVRVKVRDAVNASKLGYGYEEVENVWMDAVPTRRSAGGAKLTANHSVCVEGEVIMEPCSIVMQRDAEKAGTGLEEYLEFKFKYGPKEQVFMDIYINLPSASAETDSGCEEYVCFYYRLPASLLAVVLRTDVKNTETFRTPSISHRLRALNLTGMDSLIVTLVPRVLDPAATPLSVLASSIVYSRATPFAQS